jgi:hypothetical protein
LPDELAKNAVQMSKNSPFTRGGRDGNERMGIDLSTKQGKQRRLDGEQLPAQNWNWPRGTWFQRRLRYLRRGNKYSRELAKQDLQ